MATRLLQEDEYLLGKQWIKGTQKVSKRVLAAYYQQQPNTTWLGMPWKRWGYLLGWYGLDKEAAQQRITRIEAEFAAKIALAAGDQEAIQRLEEKKSKKLQKKTRLLTEGNTLMRWGENPVIYSPQQRELTEQRLLVFLQSKGYFDAHVSSAVELRDRKAFVTYHIQENSPFLIKNLRLKTLDKAIEKLLQGHQSQSLLKKGAPYNQQVLRQERERIYEVLSNHGYFNFDKQYIWFEVDMASAANSVTIETVVGTPKDSQVHPIFHIGQVIWDVDTDQQKTMSPGVETSLGGIAFRRLTPQFRPHILARKIPVHSSQLYRKKDLLETYQRLTRLEIFRHVNINYKELSPGRLVSRIHTAPVDRFHLAHELGFQVSQWLPMPFYSLSLASRNFFGRLETLKLAAQVGLDGVVVTAGENKIASSEALGIELSLSWPQLLLPLGDTTRTYLERFNPRTSVSIGYDFTHRPAYTQSVLKSFLSYKWQGQSNGSYELVPLRIDFLDVHNMSMDFKGHLKDIDTKRSSLYKSLQSSWLTSFSFKGTFRKKPATDADLSYSGLELLFESGGGLQNFIDLKKFMPDLAHYQYVKLGCTYSQHIPIRPSTIFAYRVNTGIAVPYGEDKVLPYNRYYFVGGGNDMRAWAPRSLGPGTYSPPQRTNNEYWPEQPGELLLQGSVELRQQLAGFWEGALFIDMGNVWTLREEGKSDGKFSIQDFHRAIAVGTGIGVRLNFRFLVLRLDLGGKLYDPSRPIGERFVGNSFSPGQVVFNFGIGYPF